MTDYFSITNCSHNLFGGNIYECDFNTEYSTTMTDIAKRIAADMKFDKYCKRNIEERNRRKAKPCN